MLYRNQEAYYIKQQPGIGGINLQIEQAGRVCYNSTNKILWDDNHQYSYSAEQFAHTLAKGNHHSVLEHAAVYLTMPIDKEDLNFFLTNKYSVVRTVGKDAFITTNYRVIQEEQHGPDYWIVNYMTPNNEPTHHAIRASIHIITDRGISAELCRHRVFSISERSTRYVNSKNMEVIVPVEYKSDIIQSASVFSINTLLDDMPANRRGSDALIWQHTMLNAENDYKTLIDRGVKPQIARRVLPLSLLSELVITAYKHDWARFLALRKYNATGPAHPDMQYLADLIEQTLLANDVLTQDEVDKISYNPTVYI